MKPQINKYSYEEDKSQFGAFYRPDKCSNVPVVIVLHGGYMKDNHTLNSYATKAIVDYLIAEHDVAIWNLEYRRMNTEGTNKNTPWPAPLIDVANGIDFLLTLAETEKLDLSKVMVVGHSVGGHLAAWAMCRQSVQIESSLYRKQPLLPD